MSVLAQLAAAADGSAGLSCLTAAPGAATDSEQGSGAGTPLAKSPCHSDAESPAESEAGRQDKQTSWRQWSPKRAASLPACVSSVCWSDDGRSCFSRSDSEESATLTAAAAEAVATSGLALAPALEHPLAAPGLPFDAETRSYLVVSLLGHCWQSPDCQALQQPALRCCLPQHLLQAVVIPPSVSRRSVPQPVCGSLSQQVVAVPLGVAITSPTMKRLGVHGLS